MSAQPAPAVVLVDDALAVADAKAALEALVASFTVTVANLDVDRVYFGYGDPLPLADLKMGDYVFCVAAAEPHLPDGVTRVGASCDLPPGRYVLKAPTKDEPFWHFDPLPPSLERVAGPSEIGLDRALYEQLKHAHAADPALVAPVSREWAERYEASFDKTMSRALTYFRDAAAAAKEIQ